MEGQPSQTAMGAAYFRSRHRRLEPPPWILDDEVSGRLLPADVTALFDAGMGRISPQLLPAMQAHFATRSRLAEDVAVAGLADERLDYVILGAGLDTFAWRHPRALEFKVWEIDHPKTQAWKRQRLAQIQLDETENVQFMPVDLEATPLDGLDLPRRSTWNWLGVTVYLERATAAATLRAIAAASQEAVVVVDFALALEDCDELGRLWRTETGAFSGSVGEQHVSLYSPDEATALVRDAGFEVVEALGARDLTSRYLDGHPNLRLAHANIFVVARTAASRP